MSILTVIQREVAIVCGVAANAVQPDARLFTFGLDSIRTMDVIIGLEAEYDIDIYETEIAPLETVADVVQLIETKIESPTTA
ncbi:MAG: phosphopantetheine-binding protein [Chloroflexota bacterium]